MTNKDAAAFKSSFHRLMATLKNTHGRLSPAELKVVQGVYFDSLQEFSLEAIEAAEKEFRTTGTSDSWFPSSVEWCDAAAEYEVQFAHQNVIRHRQLPPAPHIVAAELAAINAAREKAIAECRALGMPGVAALLEAMPLPRHLSEAIDQEYCRDCHDTGRRILEGVGIDCQCVPTNPKIRHHRAQMHRQGLIEGRRRRARELAPGRGGAGLVSVKND